MDGEIARLLRELRPYLSPPITDHDKWLLPQLDAALVRHIEQTQQQVPGSSGPEGSSQPTTAVAAAPCKCLPFVCMGLPGCRQPSINDAPEIIQPDFDSLARPSIEEQMAAGGHTIGVFREGKLIAADAQVYKEPEQASASSDWIPYDGSGMPVDAETIVNIKFRDGGIGQCQHAAHYLRWGHLQYPGDIIAYRIAKPVTQASADDGTETDSAYNVAPEWECDRLPNLHTKCKELERARNRLQRENAELRNGDIAYDGDTRIAGAKAWRKAYGDTLDRAEAAERELAKYRRIQCEAGVTLGDALDEFEKRMEVERELAALRKKLSDAVGELTLTPDAWEYEYNDWDVWKYGADCIKPTRLNAYRNIKPLYSHSTVTSLLAAAQERISSLETDLRIERDACTITIAEATEEMKEAQERIAGMESLLLKCKEALQWEQGGEPLSSLTAECINDIDSIEQLSDRQPRG